MVNLVIQKLAHFLMLDGLPLAILILATLSLISLVTTPQWLSTDPFQFLKSPRQLLPSLLSSGRSSQSPVTVPLVTPLSVTSPHRIPSDHLSVCLSNLHFLNFLISTFRFSVKPQIPFWLQIIFQFSVFSLIKYSVHDSKFNYHI